MQINLKMPYPPSVNNYWRRVGNRTIISKPGREYKKEVATLCRKLISFDKDKRLSVTILCCPPDKRRRDLDNVLKAIFDSLSGFAFEDDSQIDHIDISRGNPVKNGTIIISIQERKYGTTKHESGSGKPQ